MVCIVVVAWDLFSGFRECGKTYFLEFGTLGNTYFGDFRTLGNLFSGFRDFGKPISWISGLWEIPIFGIEGPLWDRIWDHYGAIFRISHIVGPSVGPLWDIVWDHCGAIVGPIVGLIG
jgi:hypothetical protein